LAAEAWTKNGIPIGNEFTVFKTVTIEFMIVVTVKSKRSGLNVVSYTYIITDYCVHLNIRYSLAYKTFSGSQKNFYTVHV